MVGHRSYNDRWCYWLDITNYTYIVISIKT
nr:MAG TPA: hypothetical protein [Bacteriophage sp.]